MLSCQKPEVPKRKKNGAGGGLFSSLYLFIIILKKGRKSKSSGYLSKALFLEGKAKPKTTHCSQQAPAAVG